MSLYNYQMASYDIAVFLTFIILGPSSNRYDSKISSTINRLSLSISIEAKRLPTKSTVVSGVGVVRKRTRSKGNTSSKSGCDVCFRISSTIGNRNGCSAVEESANAYTL